MRPLLFAACVVAAAALTPATDRIDLADRAVGLYARYAHCGINRRACELWSPPWHVPASLLKRIHPDDATWRREVASSWARFGVPRWFVDAIG